MKKGKKVGSLGNLFINSGAQCNNLEKVKKGNNGEKRKRVQELIGVSQNI